MKATESCIEILEARIAPAAAFVSPTTAIYDDVDGDHVTVKFTKSILTSNNVASVVQVNGTGQLTLIDLTGVASAAQGTGISVTAKLAGDGDGFVHVGQINATGIDLGAVTIHGDLGRVLAGTGSPSIPALKSLSAQSLGRFGILTGSPQLESDIVGALGKLSVKGDVAGAFVNVTGGGSGKIGSVTIGGSLLGTRTSHSGSIISTGDIGPVKIAGDMVGGSQPQSGYIKTNGKLLSVTIGGSLLGGPLFDTGEIISDGDLGPVKIGHNFQGGPAFHSGRISTGANAKLASVTIGGSLIGGSGDHSGEITTLDKVGPVKIGGNIQGGSGTHSGWLNVLGALGTVTVGGSLLGGTGSNSGEILSTSTMGAVKIAGDIVGGSNSGGASLDQSGNISSGNLLASVFVGGSIRAGVNDTGGTLTHNASIAAGRIGPMTVKGGITGSIGATGGGSIVTPVFITASGRINPSATPDATKDVAIAKISIGGRVERAAILAGYDYADLSAPSPADGDAQIGAVKIGGDWVASSLVAGVQNSGNTGTDFSHFGNASDLVIGSGNAIISAKIASITIGGQVIGSAVGGEHFGFAAEQIGSFKAGGAIIPLSHLASGFRPLAVATTNDVAIHLLGS